MKVIFAVDGSAGSQAAVRQVGQLLSPDRDQVAIYYSPPQVSLTDTSKNTAEMRERARRALANAVFQRTRPQLPDKLAAASETIVGEKPAKQGILAASEQWQAEMIVTGARGEGPLQNVLLGSVSKAVVHQAHVPVFVVRPNAAHQAGQPLRVLIATDGSPASRQATAVLGQLTWPAGTEGVLLTVVESMLAGEVPEWLEVQARNADTEAMAQAWVREHEDEKQQTADELAQYRTSLPQPFDSSRVMVAEGHPAETILKTIESERIDLAVLGAHGKGFFSRWLIGSTSEKVLTHAPCSVLIVRKHAQP